MAIIPLYPTWGIRQGNPLSPYIFIITRSIFTAIDYRHWIPITISRNGPKISHLFFTADITITSKITQTSVHSVISTLNQFTHYSGQTINYHKSKNFFSAHTSPSDKNFVLTSFNMKEGLIFGKYLGFPIFVKKSISQWLSIPPRQLQE